MAGHLLERGFEVSAFDVSERATGGGRGTRHRIEAKPR
ncbi:hypothetical protein [Sinorhizobium sp. 8-89]